MKVSFSGLCCHEHTRSDQFLLEAIREIAEVQEVRSGFPLDAATAEGIERHNSEQVVYFQNRPEPLLHLWRFRHRKQVWVPMYDTFVTPSFKYRLLMKWVGLQMISFCQSIHEWCLGAGIPSLRVTYFPEPHAAPAPLASKPPYSVFLWKRHPRGLGLYAIAEAFPKGTVGKVVLKVDRYDETLAGRNYPFEVEILRGWLPPEELQHHIAGCDYYMAPRVSEGIGHGFLEAMALGRVVVACDAPTHNEYIQEGVTGHLYRLGGQRPTSWPAPSEFASRLAEHGRSLRAQWLADRKRIQEFIRKK